MELQYLCHPYRHCEFFYCLFFQIGYAGIDPVTLYGFDQGSSLVDKIESISISVKRSYSHSETRGGLAGSISMSSDNHVRKTNYETVNLQGDDWVSIGLKETSICNTYDDCSCSLSGYGSCCFNGYCRDNEWSFDSSPTWSSNTQSTPQGGSWTSSTVLKVGYVLQTPLGYYDSVPDTFLNENYNVKYTQNCSVSGFLPAIWDEIADRVGITFEKWCIFPSGYNDMCLDVASGDYVDLIVGDFTITSYRYGIVDFTYPWDNAGRLILFNEPSTYEQSFMFLRPFSLGFMGINIIIIYMDCTFNLDIGMGNRYIFKTNIRKR